jgi:CDP-glucose 4,6-dehydratase
MSEFLASETFGDVRDFTKLSNAVERSKSELTIHFAAQPLVLSSYANPRETFDVNINGSLNVLEASLQAGCDRVLVVTTDKVYKDSGKKGGYHESDALQGWDPYAASKAAADIVTQSWLEVYRDEIRVDIARAGNVIAGGDDSESRLVPDIEKAVSFGQAVTLRNSLQVRPWQHSLDCLDGYLAIANTASGSSNTWNVGPSKGDTLFTVANVARLYLECRGSKAEVIEARREGKETDFLSLDSSRISNELSWQPKWSSGTAIKMTAEWHSRVERGESPRDVTMSQVDDYLKNNIN